MGKNVLGRGLKSLIPTFGDEETSKGVEVNSNKIKTDLGGINIIARIEISKIDTNPFQPRIKFDATALLELKQSIIEKGIIQPITVRRKGENRYELISGERRIRASKEAGLNQIPAYIIDVTSDEEMLELAIVENIQREKLGPIETATAFNNLVDRYKYTHEEIAQKVGIDRATVTNLIRLLKLPEKIKDSVDKGDISIGHAKILVGIPRVEDQIAVWQDIIRKELTVRKVEAIANILNGTKKKKKKIKKDDEVKIKSSNNEYVVSKIRGILGTKVSVETSKDDTGKLIIEFYSNEDLHRLLELFETIKI